MRQSHLVAFSALALVGLWLLIVSAKKPMPPIAIVPHHDLVRSVRETFFEETYGVRPSVRRVYVLSPNHFDAGPFSIATTTQEWSTSAGNLSADRELIQSVVGDGIAGEYRPAFLVEHGVYSVLGDIRKAFPRARVIPLIVKRSVPAVELQKLREKIHQSCSSACVVVGSIDFSHEQIEAVADMHDRRTEQLLINRDVEGIKHDAEVDAPEVLSLLAALAKERHLFWRTHAHTNSDALLGTPFGESTSHFFGTFRAHQESQPSSIVTALLLNSDSDLFSKRLTWGFDVVGVHSQSQLKDMNVHFPLVLSSCAPATTVNASVTFVCIDAFRSASDVVSEVRTRKARGERIIGLTRTMTNESDLQTLFSEGMSSAFIFTSGDTSSCTLVAEKPVFTLPTRSAAIGVFESDSARFYLSALSLVQGNTALIPQVQTSQSVCDTHKSGRGWYVFE